MVRNRHLDIDLDKNLQQIESLEILKNQIEENKLQIKMIRLVII